LRLTVLSFRDLTLPSTTFQEAAQLMRSTRWLLSQQEWLDRDKNKISKKEVRAFLTSFL
jgi:hypothetical protein